MSDPSASRLETALHGCRVNMFATGAVSALVGLPAADVQAAVETIFKGRGDALRATNVKNAVTGAAAATSLPLNIRLKPPVAAGRPARAVQRLWRPLQESNESSCSTYNQCAELPVYLTGPMKKACLLLIMLTFNGAGNALDRDQQRAKGLLEEACAGCHAVGRSGASPRAGAPPFRALGENKLYDEEFGQRLQDGLSSIHPDMPTFRFTRRDAAAVLDYLRIIQDRPKRDEKRRSE
jgi:mono/diheme cytochrome c family protein